MLSPSRPTPSGGCSDAASSAGSSRAGSCGSGSTRSAVASAPMRSHGQGTLWFNRKRGLWIAKVSLLDGRRIERSSVDRKIAAASLAEMVRLVGKGVEPRPRLTVTAFLRGWLNDLRPPVIRPQTFERYESIVRVHLVPGLGFLPLQGLRPGTVNTFLATKSGRTAQLCREVLRNALNEALRERIVEYNAAELSRAIHHEPKPTVILTADEFAAFLEGTADDRLHALYMLVATTGMREAEILGLAWDDVDLDRRTVSVNSQLVRLPGGWHLDDPKTAKGKRTIAITTTAAEALRVHRLRMAAERKPGWEFWRLVFVTEQGQPFYGYRVVNMMRGHLARLGIEPAHPLKLHELRHGLASYMKDDGISDQALADYLGHANTRLIGRYAHALPGSDRAIADRVEARLR